MTALSVFDRRSTLIASHRACARCQRPAWVSTSAGLRCVEHAVQDAGETTKGVTVPRLTRRRRA